MRKYFAAQERRKNNDRALKMYQNFGFEIIGTKENALRYQDGTYADEYLMLNKL